MFKLKVRKLKLKVRKLKLKVRKLKSKTGLKIGKFMKLKLKVRKCLSPFFRERHRKNSLILGNYLEDFTV